MGCAYRGLWLAAVAFGCSAAAWGHHSPVMFDQSQPRTLTGTVREFQWTNPHSYIQLVVKNDQGIDEEWSLEMGASVYLYNLGWRPSSVKAGDTLTVTLAPLRKGGHGGLLLKAVAADGKQIGRTPPTAPGAPSATLGATP